MCSFIISSPSFFLDAPQGPSSALNSPDLGSSHSEYQVRNETIWGFQSGLFTGTRCKSAFQAPTHSVHLHTHTHTHTHTHRVIIQAKEDDTCKQLYARLIKVVAVDNIILRDCICLLVTYLDLSRKSSKTAARNLFFIRDWFCGRKSFHGPELGGGSGEG